MKTRLLPLLCGLSLTAPFASAQNDECATAIALSNGVAVAFDTTTASLSAPGWPCAASTAPDLWYSYTPVNSGVSVEFSTCGSTYDTALEAFDGACTSLVSLVCNDDACGLQSTVRIMNVVAGQTYYVRVGGFATSSGSGTLLAAEGSPPVQGCVSNPGFESGDTAGWTFTDHPQPFIFGGVFAPGQSSGFGFFSTAPTEGVYSFFCGFDGGGAGVITLAQDVTVTAGLTPLTFDFRAAWDMVTYTGSTMDRTFDVVVRDPANGNALQSTRYLTAMAATMNLDTGTMPGSVDLSMFLGQTVTVSFELSIPETFTGPGQFELDNISCPSGGGGIGTNYCNPAVANSTGGPAVMSASGSASVASNDLTLEASALPLNAFGFFLTSQTQGSTPNPGGSQGNLCLGGQIGRYVGPGQIQNSGASGQISLLVDLTQQPTPTGFVSVQVGETWNFQAWFRDLVAGSATSNFSDGLEVAFF